MKQALMELMWCVVKILKIHIIIYKKIIKKIMKKAVELAVSETTKEVTGLTIEEVNALKK